MVGFIIKNWATIVGSGSITAIIGYILYGKKNNDIDYLAKQQSVFAKLQEELLSDREYYKREYTQSRKEHKEEVAYFRSKIDEVNKRADTLQEHFNSINLSYAKEVEVSQNWEKLYHELSKKYDDLSKKYDSVIAKLKIVEKNQK